MVTPRQDHGAEGFQGETVEGLHCDAIRTVIGAAGALNWSAAGLLASPITGPAGNHEYLLWLQDAAHGEGAWAAAVTAETVRQVVQQTLG